MKLSDYLYHQDSAGELYCCDSLEILKLMPDNSVDLVLTDPPYGVEGGRGGQQRDYRKSDYIGSWDDTPEYIQRVCVPVIRLCLAMAKTVVVTPGTRCCHSYPQPDEVGAFYTPAATRIGKFGFQNLHPIYFYGYYINRGKGALHTVRVTSEIAENNGHPCPKPIKAWTWLLARSCNENTVVLDPFLGSGTTAVAAKQLGRRFIGIEIEEKYCEIAKQRLSQEELAL